MTLDSGERILVSHEKGGPGGGALAIHEVRWWGLASGEMVFRLDLDQAEAQRVLATLAADRALPGGGPATPLGALVAYVTEARSIGDVRVKCAALGPPGKEAGGVAGATGRARISPP
jgi:hypothetical protein